MTGRDDSLLEFVSSVAGEERLKVEENLGDGYVRLRVSEAERRQAKHDIQCVEDAVIELLRNSRDAGAGCIFLATSREGPIRRIVCIDDGEGVPEHMHRTIFEPRVTSKLDSMTVDSYGVHGRGMALYSIKTNVSDACVVCSRPKRGTSLLAIADTRELSERKDQSTWPEVLVEDGKVKILKGPHNLLRCAAEFAIAHPEIELFVGSPSDIFSTMRAVAMRELGMTRLFDPSHTAELMLWQQAATFVEPARLGSASQSLYGMTLSDRSAQRILADEIPPLVSVASRLGADPQVEEASPQRKVDLAKDRRSLKIEQEDLDRLGKATREAFKPIADKYYLHEDAHVQVTSTSDEIRIKLPLRKQE